jgi:hypothetical protein
MLVATYGPLFAVAKMTNPLLVKHVVTDQKHKIKSRWDYHLTLIFLEYQLDRCRREDRG